MRSNEAETSMWVQWCARTSTYLKEKLATIPDLFISMGDFFQTSCQYVSIIINLQNYNQDGNNNNVRSQSEK